MVKAPPPTGRAIQRALVSTTSLLAIVVVALNSPASAATQIEESPGDKRVFQVETRLEVNGTLETALQGGKAQGHKLSVNADLDYFERRLSGTGRDAKALRSLRHYDLAKVVVKIDDQTTSTMLANPVRTIVAQGERNGVTHYSLGGPLTAVDLELLRVSGDSLADLSLLPAKPVDVDESWNCESWALQMLTGTDAVTKSDLKCTLESIEDDVAHVKFSGQLEGASAGAATKISISGNYEFDLREKYLRRIEVEEKEKRALGTRPGYDVVAKIEVKRSPVDGDEPLTDELVATVPLDPGDSLTSLRFDLPWGARFLHDRDWHLFRQTPQAAVLRLVDKGSFIAQCNIAKVPDAEAGSHTPEERFQADITKSLGDKLKDIVKAEELTSEDSVYRYRVTAVGQVGEIQMTWFYYLCAAPSGKQTAFVFAVETPLLERLANRDLGIVSSLSFIDAAPPTPADGKQ